MRIVTLATCHNRCRKTLNALADLHSQVLPASVSVEHVLVDDGSTDGTAQAVEKRFPDVEIISGTGDLFWAGGMRLGWEELVKHKEFDYLFAYNDDVRLEKSALARLLKTSSMYTVDGGVRKHAIIGAFRSSNGETSYSGVVHASRWHPLRFRQLDPPEEGYWMVDSLNMNGCLISKEGLGQVGFLSSFFIHGGADYEYGLKLRKCGGSIVLAAGYIGWCERDKEQDECIAGSLSVVGAYRCLMSSKNQPPYQRMRFYARHGGRLWLLFWLMPYITLPIKLLLAKIKRREAA